MFAFLLAGGLVYSAIGDRADAAILFAFATISVSIAVIQRGRSERVLEALSDLTSPRALVIRSGKRQRIPGAARSRYRNPGRRHHSLRRQDGDIDSKPDVGNPTVGSASWW
jgi:hypothetical protein